MSASDPIRTASVRDNPDQHRYEMETEEGLALAEYRRDSDAIVIFPTEVPVALRGQGLGDKLVRGVLADVRQRRLKIVPRCWFVREFISGNPEYNALSE